MEFTNLFSPIKIKNMALRNRIVMLPMSLYLHEKDSSIGDRFIAFFEARAKGGAGLIDIPFEPICDGACAEPGLFDDRFIPGVRALTSRIHSYGAKVAAQLIVSYQLVLKDNIAEVVAPSPVFNKMTRCMPRELTLDEIHTIVSAYGAAARRALEGGVDAVEVLIGAGYLLNRFLSPISNKRTDAYGGSLENRMRIILEIIESIKKEVGEDFPLLCRLNLEEQMPGGHTIRDSIEITKILKQKGIDMLIAYTGWHESPVPTVAGWLPKGAFSHLSQAIKETIDIPVVASNRINDPFAAEKILSEGKADLIGMGRALLADPELPVKALEGRTDEITYCLACGECLSQLLGVPAELNIGNTQRSLCSVNPCAGREIECILPPASPAKKIFIIGSGPAGMTAAITAAAKGHHVTIYEKGSSTGGRLNAAVLPPFKSDIQQLIKSLYARALKAGVTFRFNMEFGPKILEEEKPDALVLAIGAVPIIPPIPGIDGANVVLAEDALTGRKSVQGAIVVIGGGLVGCETAEFLLERGVTDVTVIEMLDRIADNVARTTRPFFLERLRKQGIKMEANTTATEITDKGVTVQNKDNTRFIPADTVVLAAGFKPDSQTFDFYKTGPWEVYSIGDCKQARMIKDAIEEGFAIGKLL